MNQWTSSFPYQPASILTKLHYVFLDTVRWCCGWWHHCSHWWRMCFLRRTKKRPSQTSRVSIVSPPGHLQRIWNRRAASIYLGVKLVVSISFYYSITKMSAWLHSIFVVGGLLYFMVELNLLWSLTNSGGAVWTGQFCTFSAETGFEWGPAYQCWIEQTLYAPIINAMNQDPIYFQKLVIY